MAYIGTFLWSEKRVTIASILVLNPEIILLDEPTAGQDQRHYREMMDFLDQLNAKGHTIVMITHDMQLMLDYSDRAVVVVDGQIIEDASPAEILSDVACDRTGQFERNLYIPFGRTS
ncbi:cobalt ABC transporter, ATP binding protein [Streptococcus infantarius subsp. infantarius]|nr:cobalt ABC transporter, ATP binding protein [Streptococcus infantarius subsp. infantarius]